jgi:putative hydrolase of the HAD superfamily
MYKAILFDFFGVFCSDLTLSWFKKSVPHYEQRLDAFYELCRRSDRGEMTLLAFHEELAKLTHMSVDEVTIGIEKEAVINQPLIDFTKSLKNRYKMAIVSNATDEWINPIVSEHGMSTFFDAMIISGNIGSVKPEKAIFDYALNMLAVRADEAVFIDDRLPNVEAATSYGIKSLLFTGDNTTLIKELEELGVSSSMME